MKLEVRVRMYPVEADRPLKNGNCYLVAKKDKRAFPCIRDNDKWVRIGRRGRGGVHRGIRYVAEGDHDWMMRKMGRQIRDLKVEAKSALKPRHIRFCLFYGTVV